MWKLEYAYSKRHMQLLSNPLLLRAQPLSSIWWLKLTNISISILKIKSVSTLLLQMSLAKPKWLSKEKKKEEEKMRVTSEKKQSIFRDSTHKIHK